MAFVEMDDRAILTQALQSMSAHMAGRVDESLVPTESFAADGAVEQMDTDTDIDVPDAPGEHTEDDGHDHGAPAGKSSSAYAWGGHQNGRIPAKELKAIGEGSHKLEASAADAWMAMRAAAAKEGVNISLTDSYRSYAAQVSVRQRKGHVVATATPGRSVHGWGRAVDANVKDPEALAWLRRNGRRFGWVNPAWAQKGGKNFEPWHWEYVGGTN